MGEYSLEAKGDKSLVLIIYDIVDNKRRNRLAKYLQGYGFRVQKSAFEAVITKSMYRRLLEELPFYANPEDSIRMYRLVGYSEVHTWGVDTDIDSEEVIII